MDINKTNNPGNSTRPVDEDVMDLSLNIPITLSAETGDGIDTNDEVFVIGEQSSEEDVPKDATMVMKEKVELRTTTQTNACDDANARPAVEEKVVERVGEERVVEDSKKERTVLLLRTIKFEKQYCNSDDDDDSTTKKESENNTGEDGSGIIGRRNLDPLPDDILPVIIMPQCLGDRISAERVLTAAAALVSNVHIDLGKGASDKKPADAIEDTANGAPDKGRLIPSVYIAEHVLTAVPAGGSEHTAKGASAPTPCLALITAADMKHMITPDLPKARENLPAGPPSPKPGCSGVRRRAEKRDPPDPRKLLVNAVDLTITSDSDYCDVASDYERDNKFESESDCEASKKKKTKKRKGSDHCRCCRFYGKKARRPKRKESDENRVEAESSKENSSEIKSSIGNPLEIESSSGSADSAGSQREDSVKLNSDTGAEGIDNISQDKEIKLKTAELKEQTTDPSPKSQNGDVNGLKSSSAIEKDKNKDKSQSTPKKPTPEPEPKAQLRRSLRTIKRKRYDMDLGNGDDGSDCDEFLPSESSRKKSKSTAASTKIPVDVTSRQSKFNYGNNNKKETSVVLIDSKFAPGKALGSHVNQRQQNQKASGITVSDPQSLYKNIIARGTSVTPIPPTPAPVRVNASTQSPSPQPILPSLTDDMFVVEAPSFIVPYVYEKPSIKPFREFVDVLGSELAEQKAKEERAEREKREKEKKEKIERGEIDESEVAEPEKNEKPEKPEDSGEIQQNEKPKVEPEAMEVVDESQKKKSQKREGRKRRNADDDDESWDGESSGSEEEAASDDENKTVVIKEKIDDSANIKDVTELTVDKVVNGKVDNYFDCTLGKFFLDIGLGLVQEVVQTDLLKLQKWKLYKEKKLGLYTAPTESAVLALKKNLEFSKRNNASFHFPQNRCHICDFHTESSTVMSHHLEAPHFKNGLYKCNFCAYEVRSPHDILFHTETVHNVRSRLERATTYHQCANCAFEDNGKGKLARHMIACAKKFKPDFNLAPDPEWEPPAKIPKQTAKARNHIIGPYPSMFQRSHAMMGPSSRPLVGTTIANPIPIGYKPRNRSPMVATVRPTPIQGNAIMRGGVTIRHSNPAMLNNLALGKSVLVPRPYNQPSISITPLPRVQPQPAVPQPGPIKSRQTCILCEICDGYIRDLEQLRHHMQFVHKVRIHPKMIYSRPPLNCQKCQLRFFTDQGLERHLLGSHGLVTSNMQQAANKGKDAGRCPVCGRVYQWKLLNHVSRDHVITLKAAHLSYKCTVCAATFALYKEFEEHVYAAHTVGAKGSASSLRSKSSDKGRPADDIIPESLKKNTQVTITPQPAKGPVTASAVYTPVSLAVTVSMSPVVTVSPAAERDKTDRVTDKDVTDRDVADKDATDRDVTDKDVTDRDVTDKDVTDRDVTDKDVSDRDVTDKDMNDRDVADKDVADKDATDSEVTDIPMTDLSTESTNDDTTEEANSSAPPSSVTKETAEEPSAGTEAAEKDGKMEE